MVLRRWFLGLGFLLVLALLVAWRQATRPYVYQGALIDPPVPAADFTLSDQNEQPFRLSQQHGRVVLLFFGYTHCPDVCPATLTVYKKIKDSLGGESEQVRFVFITVDPERDTPEQLRRFVGAFDPSFIGLSGSREQLQAVWQAYGVYRAEQQVESALDYVVDHSTRIYAIDRQGNWRLTYPFEMDWQAIARDVRHLIRE
jgi:protein SCO1/2